MHAFFSLYIFITTLGGSNIRRVQLQQYYEHTHTHTHTHTAPTMPQGLTVDNDGAYALSVTWGAPADNGGRQIVNYRLEIREVGRGGPFVELDRVSGVSQTITNSSQFIISENTTYE